MARQHGLIDDFSEELLSTPEVQLTVVTAAADLAERWLAAVAELREVTICPGDRVVLEVTLQPTQRLCLVVVDGDGRRHSLVSRDYAPPSIH